MRRGRVFSFWGSKSVDFAKHLDFDKRLSTVDDLQLEAQVIDCRYRELFKVHDECTELGFAVHHLIHLDVHSTRPIFCH